MEAEKGRNEAASSGNVPAKVRSEGRLFWYTFGAFAVANALIIVAAALGAHNMALAIAIPVLGILVCVGWLLVCVAGFGFISYFVPARAKTHGPGWARSVYTRWITAGIILAFILGNAAVMVGGILCSTGTLKCRMMTCFSRKADDQPAKVAPEGPAGVRP
jgi:hypothetical protein